MKPEEYVALAKRTENLGIKDIAGRLKESQMGMLKVLDQAIHMGNQLDMVKKQFFYGKQPPYHMDVQSPKCFKEAFMDTTGPQFEERLSDETFIRCLHAAIGLFTESTEIFEALAKYLKTGTMDKVNLSEEGGDHMWYLAILSDAIGSPITEMWDKNIKKLAARHGDKFSTEGVLNRDLDNERKILEE